MRTPAHRALAVAAVLATPLAGCTWGTPQPSIDKLSVPKDFTFANTRSVAVQIDAGKAMLGASGWASLELARPDGKLVYKGAIGAGHPLSLKLAVAHKDAALRATLITDDGAHHDASIPVSGETSTFTF